MDTLEKWLKGLLEHPINVWDQKYLYEEDFRRELKALQLPKTKQNRLNANILSKKLLIRLHAYLRGHACEDAVWSVLVLYLAHPLPDVIAHDLVDREIAILELGHTRQQDEVQWRLAQSVDEAFYTLVLERYTESQYTLEDFQCLIDQRPDDSVLELLAAERASSIEKEAVFLAIKKV